MPLITNTPYFEKENLINIFAPILFLIIWSGGALFSKLGLQYADTWSFLFLRSTLALLLLGILFLSKKEYRAGIPKLNTHALFLIIISGLLLQVLYLVFYFLSINTQLSLGMIILILGTQPIMTKLITSKKTKLIDLGLLFMCFLGLAIATLGYHKIEQLNLIGIGLAIAALLSITSGTIIQSKISSPPILTLFIQTLMALIIFGVITFSRGLVFNFLFLLYYGWAVSSL